MIIAQVRTGPPCPGPCPVPIERSALHLSSSTTWRARWARRPGRDEASRRPSGAPCGRDLPDDRSLQMSNTSHKKVTTVGVALIPVGGAASLPIHSAPTPPAGTRVGARRRTQSQLSVEIAHAVGAATELRSFADYTAQFSASAPPATQLADAPRGLLLAVDGEATRRRLARLRERARVARVVVHARSDQRDSAVLACSGAARSVALGGAAVALCALGRADGSGAAGTSSQGEDGAGGAGDDDDGSGHDGDDGAAGRCDRSARMRR